MSTKFIRPRGTEDIYYEYSQKFQTLTTTFYKLAHMYGYSFIETPTIEHKELFIRSVGSSDIVHKEFYDFVDKGDREIVLRPEGTAGVIRAVVENKMLDKYPHPLKFFYIEQMFRYERPQSGRLRQFHQFGVECISTNSYNDDVEMILMATDIIKSLGIKQCELSINNIGNFQTRALWTKALSEYFHKYEKDLTEDSLKRIDVNPLRILDDKIDGKKDFVKNAPAIDEFLTKEEVEYFDNIKNALDKLNIKYVVDKSMVRGLDYYTNFVFEINSTHEGLAGQPTLIGGGRYANLVKELNGNIDAPSTGFATGIERLIIACDLENKEWDNIETVDTIVISLDQSTNLYVQQILAELRKNNISCTCNFSSNKIKNGFKLAETLKAKFVIIAGKKEFENNSIEIKNQITMEQKTIGLNEMISFIKKGK